MGEELAKALTEQQNLCLEWLSVRDYSPSTIKTYQSDLNGFIRWVEDQSELRELSDLTTSALQDYLVHLSLRGSKMVRRGQSKKLLSAASKQRQIAALLQLFGHLVKQGLLLTNPTHELERPRQNHPLPRGILSVEEVFQVLAQASGSTPIDIRNRAALELLYTTGMRSGEFQKLTLSSLRLEERLVLIDGKGKRERLVPVGEEATRAVTRYLKEARSRFPTNDLNALFLSRQGGPMQAYSLLRALRGLLKKTKIQKDIDLHSIRHSCATHMLQNGADIRYIQVMLGHATLQTTQVYTRVDTTDLRRMVDECHPREKF